VSIPKDSPESILDDIWKWAQTYKMRINEENKSLWYLTDEFGSKIRHSGDANFVMVPFFCQYYGYSISLLFPKRNCKLMEEIARDYSYGEKDPDNLRTCLYPWVQSKLSASTVPSQKPREYFEKVADKMEKTLPAIESFMIPFISVPEGTVKVYSEIKYVDDTLTDPRFQLVSEKSEADVLWLSREINDFNNQFDTGPGQLVNSIPCQYLMTVKADLAELAKRIKGQTWHPLTYDIHSELENFIVEFERREAESLNNVWILKSWNAQRGAITRVSKNLNQIIRHRETLHPYVIQKFITNQVQLKGKAFYYRYHFMIKSIEPIEAYVIDVVRGKPTENYLKN
jgi:tubulin--tyrosine ligase-like protein 12